MFKTALVVFLVCLISNVFSANILLYDPLEDSDSSTVNDGTATSITYGTGKYANAAVFSSGSSIAYDMEQPFNIHKGTVSFWLKPNFNGSTLASSIPILGVKLRDGYFRLYIYSGAANSARLVLKMNDPNGTTRAVESSQAAIGLEASGDGVRSWTSGNWYYVQVSWDLTGSNNKVKMNIDGNTGESTTSMSGLDFDEAIVNNIVYLGNFEGGTGNFDGSIDEFKYSDSYISDTSSLMLHDNCETLDKMEDAAGAVQSGIEMVSRKRITGVEIPRDMAVYVDGSDTLHYPLVPGQNCPSDISTGTVEFWFKPDWSGDDYTENKYLMNLRTSNSSEQIYIYFYYNGGTRILVAKYQENSTTKRTTQVSDSTILSSIKADQWHHIKYYWDHTTNKTELFLNGESVAQYSGTVNALTGTPDKLYIGSVFSGVYQADACFDDIKFYSTGHSTSFPEIFQNEPQAVPTYHCMSLYWDMPFGATLDTEDYSCLVQYKKRGDSTWLDGMDLVWHPYDHEFRGSVVHLTPDTVYDFKLTCDSITKTISMKTMCEPDSLPVNSTTTISSRTTMLDYGSITNGTALGYNVYDGQGTAIISGALLPAVRFMNRSYVILKNFTIDGAKSGIDIRGNCKNIIFQNITFKNINDQYGTSGVADKSKHAIRVVQLKSTDKTRVRRLTVEECTVENLNYSANTWNDYHPDPSVNSGNTTKHPAGSCAFKSQNGLERQVVIRYNEFGSSDGNYYDDVIHGGVGGGFGEDVDIYGNYVEYAADDGIEVDSHGMNNRVFGNYINYCYVGVSSQESIYGPLYIFRNIFEQSAPDYTSGGKFAKIGPAAGWMENMPAHHATEYWFNNTVLNRDSSGVERGFQTIAGPKDNVIVKNNIVEARSTAITAISINYGVDDDIDYNICNKAISPSTSNVNGTTTTSFASYYDNLSYWNSSTGEANTFIDSLSDGYDEGVKIDNFTTYFDTGTTPDAGAMDHGKSDNMKFGTNASSYYVSGKWF
jgi:Concanavalin A-like lectin/glucanases superfamily